MLVLQVLQGPDRGMSFGLPSHEPQLIGRSSEALPLNDTTVSRRHAELTPDDGQSPAAGTVVSCVQMVNVTLTYATTGSNQFNARLPIELIDITPPTIEVNLDWMGGAPHVSFGGVMRFVTPALVFPIIDVLDACGIASQEMLLNGEPYEPGMPISEKGLHFLTVLAIDDAGNEAMDSFVFEIATRASHTAAAVVESTECFYNSEGKVESFEATVLIGAGDFDHRDILLSSVRLGLRGPDGRWINAGRITIKDAFIPGTQQLDHEGVGAIVNPCNWRMVFAVDFGGAPLDICPVFLDIFGVDHDAGEIVFDWGASTINVAMSDAHVELAGLIDIVEPCEPCDPGDPDCKPEPEQPVPCQKVSVFHQFENPACVLPWAAGVGGGTGCMPGSGGSSRAWARAMLITGTASSTASAPALGWCNSGSGQCTSSAIGLLFVDLVGDCCNCSIDIKTGAQMNWLVAVMGTVSPTGVLMGTAGTSGLFSFVDMCGGAFVPGGNAILVDETTVPVVVPGSTGSVPVTCLSTGCWAFLSIDTTVSVSTTSSIDSGIWQSTCTSGARMSGNLLSIGITAMASPCNPGPGEPLEPVEIE